MVKDKPYFLLDKPRMKIKKICRRPNDAWIGYARKRSGAELSLSFLTKKYLH